MPRQAQHEELLYILTLSLSKGEERVAEGERNGQRTISTDERRELGRAAGDKRADLNTYADRR